MPRSVFGMPVLVALLAALAATACGDDDYEGGDGGADTETDSPCTGDVVEFADNELEDGIRDAIGKEEGVLCAEDVDDLTDLFVYGPGVEDLNGIQYLVALVNLDLSFNQVTDLAPLSDLVELRSLVVDSNQVSDLAPLTGLTALSGIFLEDNQVTDLAPLVANEGIGNQDYLDLENNPIDQDEQAENIQTLCDRGVVIYPFCDHDIDVD